MPFPHSVLPSFPTLNGATADGEVTYCQVEPKA